MLFKITLINGPNLNLVGKREPTIYGNEDITSYTNKLKEKYSEITFESYQTNVEGEIINLLQNAVNSDGIILNAGGYSHTSIAIADTIAAIETPCVEVHISNIYKREPLRHQSLTGKNCIGVITGFGLFSYELGLQALLHTLNT